MGSMRGLNATSGFYAFSVLVAGFGTMLGSSPVWAQSNSGFQVVTPPPLAAAPVTPQTQGFPPSPSKPRPLPQTYAPSPGRPTASAERHDETAGRYAVLRGDKDTGCMLTLDDRAKGPQGTSRAILAPACRDSGLVIFDPVGWELAKGELVLHARKGHNIQLQRQPAGNWVKDVSTPRPLTLRRI